jgi:VCBS repeat-containing protein
VDDAPRPGTDSYQVDEDGVLVVDGGAIKGVLFNDLEVDGQTLTLTQNTNPLHGALVINSDGTFTYTPVGEYFGTDSFTYKVSDGLTEVGPVTVDITVNPINDAPIATADSFTTNEDTTLNVGIPGLLANDNDIDGPPLSTNLVQGPLHALLFNLNGDGSFDYLPAANYYGPDSFTYQAFDGSLASNTVTVSLTVFPVQDAVVANDDLIGWNTSGAPLRINVLANDVDPDRDPLRIVSYTRPALGRLVRSGSTLVYTPNRGAVGVDTFSYTVSDGRGHSDTADVQVNVLDVVAPKVQNVRLHYGAAQSFDIATNSRSVLPWSNVASISIVFSEGVQSVPLGTALSLTRAGGTPVPVTLVGFDAATRTGTWSIDAPIGIDRLTLRLAAVGVSDIAGNPMAADWVKSFGVLPGDYNGDGEVGDADVNAIKSRISKAGQTILRSDQRFADIDGSGIVDQTDLTLATNNKGKRYR